LGKSTIFKEFGLERGVNLQFVFSNLWAGHLKLIPRKAPQVLNVLQRKPWLVLKRSKNLPEKQPASMGELFKLYLASIKGYLLA